MNIRVLPILLICYLLFPDSSFGQNCACTNCPGVAEVFSTTSYDFILQDAINDDLSNSNQGICQIIVQFAPEHLWTLEMTVTSPSGQTVNIIGPSSNQFGFTGPLPWEISFIPCADPAEPDLGFSDTWSNNQNWLSGDFYNGSYYPFSGCLEDFNTGPVNGTWTLTVTNNSPVNTASIVNFTVIPCDLSGIPCFDCEARESELMDALPQDICQGDPSLELKFPPTFDTIPDSSQYSYAYLVSSGDTIIQVDSLLDLTGFVHGQYEVCGISYRTSDSLRLPIPADQMTVSELRTELESIYNIFCAELSRNCQPINIIGHDTTFLTERLCIGESFDFIDSTILTNGVYYNSEISSINCDSIIKLNIEFLPARDTVIFDTICPGNLYLFGGDLIADEGTYFHDTITSIGCDSLVELRLSIYNRPIATIDTVLCFGEEIEVGNFTYNSTGDFEIIIDTDDPCDSLVVLNLQVLNPVVVIDNPVLLNCLNNPLQLDASNSIGQNLFYEWTDVDNAGQGFATDSTSAIVDVVLEGQYALVVTDSLNGVGCSQSATTFVIEDFSLPQVVVTLPTITCSSMLGQIDLIPLSNISQYQWEGPNGFNSGLPDPIINEPGSYDLYITGINGCIDSISYFVSADTLAPAFILSPLDTITCIQTSVNIHLDYTGNFLISGIAPGGIPFSGNDFLSTSAGQHELAVQNLDNGCRADTIFSVVENTDVPTYLISEPIITCDEPSGNLSAIAIEQYNYQWSNSVTILSNDSTVVVEEYGPYFLNVIGSNGCFIRDTFEIEVDTIAPDLSISGGAITCTDTILNLEGISLTPNLTYQWSNSSGFISNDQTIQISEIDTYELVAQAPNGCETTTEFTPSIDTIHPFIELPTINIDCNNPSITIIPSTVSNYQSIIWTGPNSFLSNEIEPTISDTGEYTVELIAANGCSYFETFEVQSDFDQPDLVLTTDSLNCYSTIGELTAQSNQAISINWIGPGGFGSANFDIQVSQPGLYTAQVTGANGCQRDSVIEVIADFIPPQLSLQNDEINCLDSLAEIGDSTLNSDWEFLWTGPNGFSSNLNYQLVDIPGNYQLSVTGENGCQSLENVTVDIDTLTIQIELTPDTLNCIVSNVLLAPIFSENPQTIGWLLPDNSTSANVSLNTNQPGTHEINVLATNGCATNLIFEVVIDSIAPSLSIDPLALNCDEESLPASINYTAINPQFTWSGPNGFTSNIATPEIDEEGVYELIVESSNGCTVLDSILVTNDITLPIFSIEDDTLNCLETTLNLQPDYIGPYSFEWTDASGILSNTANLNISNPGDIQLNVINNENGCEDSTSIIIFIDTIAPNTNLGSFELSCITAQVELIPDDTLSNWSYLWNGPAGFSSTLPNPLAGIAGNYNLEITGLNGCTTTLQTEVISNDSVPDLSFTLDTITCSDSIANIQVFSTIAGTNFSWTGPSGFVSINDNVELLNAGVYEVEGIASNGCVVIADIEILTDTLSSDFTVMDTMLNCWSPTIIMVPSSSDDLTYRWFDQLGVPISAESFEINAADTYVVEGISANGCISERTYLVTSDFNLPIISVLNDSINCQDTVVNLIGTSQNFMDSIFWRGPSSFFSLDNSPEINIPGSYWLNAIGPNGCLDSLELLVALDTISPQTILVADTISCQDSIANVSALFLNSNWLLDWSGPGGFNSDSIAVETSTPGLFQLELTGENYCTSTFDVEVNIDQDVPTVSVLDSILNCNNPNLIFTPIVSGNIDQYSWTDGIVEISNNDFVSISDTGIYFLNIVGENGCSANTSFAVLADYAQPIFTSNSDTINCQDSLVTLDLSTNSTYSVEWNGPGGFSSIELNPTTSEPGFYQFEITGSNGCDTSAVIEIVADTIAPDILLSTDLINCSIDSVLIEITGDFEDVSWTVNGASINDDAELWILETSTVEGLFSGSNECESIFILEVLEDISPPQFDLNAAVITCDELAADLELITSDSLNSILWSGPNGFSQNQAQTSTTVSGWYYGNVVGSNFCVGTDSVFVDENLDLPTLVVTGDTIDCTGNEISVSTNSSLEIDTYNWSGPNGYNSSLPISVVTEAGTYDLSIVGLNGCEENYSVEVLPAIFPEIIDIQGNNALDCDSTSSQLFANVGLPDFDYSLNWTFENLEVSQNQNLVVQESGTYYFQINNLENGCITVDSVVVSVDTLAPTLLISSINGLTITCENSDLLLEGFTGGDIALYTFDWTFENSQISSTNNVEINVPGVYHLSVMSNANGCVIQDSVVVVIDNEVPQVEVQGFNTLNCYTPTLELEAIHGNLNNYSLFWFLDNVNIPGSDNNELLTINESGLYELIIINEETGCENVDTVLVSENFELPTLNFDQSNLIDCFAPTATVSLLSNSNEQIDYWWIENADTIGWNEDVILSSSEDLSLIGILNSSGCSSMIPVDLEIGNLGPEAVEIIDEQPICPEDLGSISIGNVQGGVGPFLFAFENFLFEDTQIYNNLIAGDYTLTVQDSDGCEYSEEVEILLPLPVNVELGDDQTIGLGDSIWLTAQSFSNIEFYNWQDSSLCDNCANQFVNPTQTTTYYLEVIDDRGCLSQDEVTIFVQEKPIGYFPNIFSPNNDGNNDFYEPAFSSSVQNVLDFSIFSRWGEKVFGVKNVDPNSPGIKWNGTNNGKQLNPAVFIFKVEVLLKNGKKASLAGDLTLFK